MRQHLLAAWLWASLALAVEPQQQSCHLGKQEQSSSLIQSTSAKQKVAFQGVELHESHQEAPLVHPSLLHLQGAAKFLQGLPLRAWRQLSNVTLLADLGGSTLVREPSGVWIALFILSGLTCIVALCAMLDPFGYNAKPPPPVAERGVTPIDVFGVRVPFSSPTLGRPSVAASELPPQPSEGVLCPGLVVPSGCECTLLVPRLIGQHGKASVDDVKGVPVLHAQFDTRRSASKWLVLTSSTTEATVFASCYKSRVAGELEIRDAGGKFFGSLRVSHHGGEETSFEVSTLAGAQVRLWLKGGVELSATDTRLGQAMATATATMDRPSCRTVRIGPLVDAGLLTVAVLASDLLTPPPDAGVSDYMSPRARHTDGVPQTPAGASSLSVV